MEREKIIATLTEMCKVLEIPQPTLYLYPERAEVSIASKPSQEWFKEHPNASGVAVIGEDRFFVVLNTSIATDSRELKYILLHELFHRKYPDAPEEDIRKLMERELLTNPSLKQIYLSK